MDWIVHGVAKSWTQLSDFHFHFSLHKDTQDKAGRQPWPSPGVWGPDPSLRLFTVNPGPQNAKETVSTMQQMYVIVSFQASQVVLVVKNLPVNARDLRDAGSILGLERSPGGGHGNPLQHSCLENPQGQRSLVGYSPRGSQRVGHD